MGEPTEQWIAQRARTHGAFDVEVVDLAEIDLPMSAGPKHPRLADNTPQSTRDLSDLITRADGYVFVHPSTTTASTPRRRTPWTT